MVVWFNIIPWYVDIDTCQNHPVTDIPCFTVHPCNTADAMQEIIGSREFSGLEYLLVWIGLIGGCVGLNLPKELAID